MQIKNICQKSSSLRFQSRTHGKRYFADTDDEIAAAINDIKKGCGDQDFMADTVRLHGFGIHEQEKLKTIGCKPQLFDEMEHYIAKLPGLLMNYKLDFDGSTSI
jgi:hypothetical protein